VPEGAAVVLRLDPGLAFGTGTHPTTRLCLQWIDGHDFSGQTVLDFGCGSGVLGIVAALKGACRVVCVDNDPQALTATNENALRNAVGDVIQALNPEQFASEYPVNNDAKDAGFDVVLANILAGPLIELAALLLSQLHINGDVVLSGVLTAQSSEVAAAYQAQTSKMVVVDDDGWVRLHGRKSNELPDAIEFQK